MAGFHTKTFLTNDDYYTPSYAWDNIRHLIPRDKIIWEAFFGDGSSGEYLKQLGFNVIHEPIDFFENDRGDIVVSNPPFSKCKEILTRLVELDKPFILIMPSSKINTSYVRELFKNNHLQIIIPRKRIHFIKTKDGRAIENEKSNCNFDCFYYAFKMGFQNDIIWLE